MRNDDVAYRGAGGSGLATSNGGCAREESSIAFAMKKLASYGYRVAITTIYVLVLQRHTSSGSIARVKSTASKPPYAIRRMHTSDSE